MGGSEPPYIYTHPTHRQLAYPYSEFNPKAVTQASYAARRAVNRNSPPKKQTGPLINFNQHPDSHVPVHGSQHAYKPLPPNTSSVIAGVRWAQFGLRILQEVAALGLLVATICIKGPNGYEKFLIRVPQAWDSLINLYAVYHLARPANTRPPGSSVAYHMFSLVMDTGLIPLYVYIALATNSNRQLDVPRYKSGGEMEPGNWRWTSVFNGQSATDTLLLVTFIGAIILASLHLISCGLDLYLLIMFRKISHLPPDMNPLDRPKKKNKSKHEYKDSELSLLGGYGEGSAQDEGPQVPFEHSRVGSKTSLAYTPRTPARYSRQPQPPPPSNEEAEDWPLTREISAPQPEAEKHKRQLLDDNWYVLDDNEDSKFTYAPSTKSSRYYATKTDDRPPIPRHDSFEPAEEVGESLQVNKVPQPLGMNPPTPTTGMSRSQTMSSSIYSEPASALNHSDTVIRSPPQKRYGNLGGNNQSGKSRVISRSGADISDESVMHIDDSQQLRSRREVSGKVVEEGRGGWWNFRT
ncbi:hypothetical protein K470DRAFT_230058 [Piedraia hortae CBS 480.64]|uniref:Uncharacterized protein n=1 Tax=Piedraia hortae CBS 480.64 TaxID=1314780 RepID=A0A6A7C1X3_9PEZI|nr:hypothetical protein K470DRAFT_230058 [Piedraia hortae CBS 480.64]